jgi:hypothetical protein
MIKMVEQILLAAYIVCMIYATKEIVVGLKDYTKVNRIWEECNKRMPETGVNRKYAVGIVIGVISAILAIGAILIILLSPLILIYMDISSKIRTHRVSDELAAAIINNMNNGKTGNPLFRNVVITDEAKEFTITEWDGTKNKVLAYRDDNYISVAYKNGTCHTVTEEYFRSIISGEGGRITDLEGWFGKTIN